MTGILDWVTVYEPLSRMDGSVPKTQVAAYSLRQLAERESLSRDGVNGMLFDAGLYDYHWHMVWGDDFATPDEALAARIADADGYVIFLHGWTGSNAIWEDLPAMIAAENRRLVCLVVDHNGFGGTAFADEMPDFGRCSPIGAMHAAERWFSLLGLRRQPGERHLKTVNFVGHSMGGAALFFLREEDWRLGEMTRLALAPALLLHDDMHRAFYTTLGLGIGLVGRIRALEVVESLVKPGVLDALTDGATQPVIDEHARIYESTPRSITARTFAAMGVIQEHPTPHKWEFMKIVLGHKDRLVGLIPMIDLLQELDFNADQLRVVMGTHYFFSLGEAQKRWHQQNRWIVLEDILQLHEQAMKRQKSG